MDGQEEGRGGGKGRTTFISVAVDTWPHGARRFERSSVQRFEAVIIEWFLKQILGTEDT